MSFPDVQLATPYVAQTVYESNTVAVIQVDDDVANKVLQAFCQLGDNPSFKYWVPVLSGDDYTVDYTNAMITAAIQAYFLNA